MCERKPCKTMGQLKTAIHKAFPSVNQNLLAELVLDYLRGADAQLLRDYLAPFTLRCEFYTADDAPISVHIMVYNCDYATVSQLIGSGEALLLSAESLRKLGNALHPTNSLYIKFDENYQLQFEMVR